MQADKFIAHLTRSRRLLTPLSRDLRGKPPVRTFRVSERERAELQYPWGFAITVLEVADNLS